MLTVWPELTFQTDNIIYIWEVKHKSETALRLMGGKQKSTLRTCWGVLNGVRLCCVPLPGSLLGGG